MNSFIMPIRCPRCAGKVRPVTVGEPQDGGTNINAVLRCARRFCRHEFSVHIYIMSIGTYTESGELHGTSEAFKRHRELGEKLCSLCNDYNTRRNATSREEARANA